MPWRCRRFRRIPVCRRRRRCDRRAGRRCRSIHSVVPGVSTRSRGRGPRIAFSSDDSPTFGRPRIATRIASSGVSSRRPAPGSCSTITSRRSPLPCPCSAESGPRLAKAQAVQVERQALLRGIVDLVRDQRHGLARAAQDVRDFFVPRRHSGARVDDEENEVGFPDRQLGLRGDRLRHRRWSAMSTPPVSMRRKRFPFHSAIAPCDRASRRGLVHDRRRDPVSLLIERRLADVREADDRDRPVQRLLLCRPSRGRDRERGRPCSCVVTRNSHSRRAPAGCRPLPRGTPWSSRMMADVEAARRMRPRPVEVAESPELRAVDGAADDGGASLHGDHRGAGKDGPGSALPCAFGEHCRARRRGERSRA